MKTSLITKTILAIGFLQFTGVGALAQKVTTEVNKTASFDKFRTYAFKPGLLTIGGNENQLEPVLLDALRNELNARGLTEVQEKPNVYVTIGAEFVTIPHAFVHAP